MYKIFGSVGLSDVQNPQSNPKKPQVFRLQVKKTVFSPPPAAPPCFFFPSDVMSKPEMGVYG